MPVTRVKLNAAKHPKLANEQIFSSRPLVPRYVKVKKAKAKIYVQIADPQSNQKEEIIEKINTEHF